MIKKRIEPMLFTATSFAVVPIATLLAVLILCGCATTISLRVPRRPTLDTSEIKRVAVMPFEFGRRDRDAAKLSRYASTVAADRIRATNNFTLISSDMVESRKRAGQGFDDLVDALFTGRIVRVAETTREEQAQRKDRESGEMVAYTYYIREIEVEFTYSFVLARDGTIIGPLTRKGTSSDRKETEATLASTEMLARTVIDNQMASLRYDIAPYTVTVNRNIVKEPDKSLRPQMESTLSLVKSGNYRGARDAYIEIYENHKSVAAAENASILYEALGETAAGAEFMQRVVTETGSPRARDALARMNRELRETAAVVEFRNKVSRDPAERAADVAVGELDKFLPDDARVWIVKESADDSALLNSIIDNMTALFLREGVTVVDRRSANLIQAEQEFQMSGHVSDSEIQNVGNAAGANRIIVVSVLGSGASRRMQVRVLDIERGVILMQSDASAKWNL